MLMRDTNRHVLTKAPAASNRLTFLKVHSPAFDLSMLFFSPGNQQLSWRMQQWVIFSWLWIIYKSRKDKNKLHIATSSYMTQHLMYNSVKTNAMLTVIKEYPLRLNCQKPWGLTNFVFCFVNKLNISFNIQSYFYF